MTEQTDFSERSRSDGATWATALHVTNGDCTVPELRATGLAHRIVCWRDALHEGPVPDVPADELRRIRAPFLAGEDAADLGTTEEFAERDRILESHRDGDYVLWFEADLYDQLQLIQIVASLHELKVPASRITLICIGEYPGIAHFGGHEDQIALNRIDRWIGGVHLHGQALPWRWNEGTETITTHSS